MASEEEKERRRLRRRNHIAYDLASSKYRQRRIEKKKDKYDGLHYDEY